MLKYRLRAVVEIHHILLRKYLTFCIHSSPDTSIQIENPYSCQLHFATPVFPITVKGFNASGRWRLETQRRGA
jgi:hypothetical protein